MKIDGNKISKTVEKELKEKLKKLHLTGITPKLAIIHIGDDPLSKNYVLQKEKKAKDLGIGITTLNLPIYISKEELKAKVDELNNNDSVQGIIIQRPLPWQIDSKFATNIIKREKDVDGFKNDSFFKSPIAQGVFEVLKEIYKESVLSELKTKNIVIIGKGETGGKPIIDFLKEQGIETIVIDTKTKNPEEVIKKTDIIISTVGKENIINTANLKPGVVLIGVGMYKDKNGKLQTDYDQDKIKKIASFYTPVPGGIGPLTVTMLYKNLCDATRYS